MLGFGWKVAGCLALFQAIKMGGLKMVRLPPKTDQNHGFLDMIGWGWKVDRKLALFMLINMGVLGFRVGA